MPEFGQMAPPFILNPWRPRRTMKDIEPLAFSFQLRNSPTEVQPYLTINLPIRSLKTGFPILIEMSPANSQLASAKKHAPHRPKKMADCWESTILLDKKGW